MTAPDPRLNVVRAVWRNYDRPADQFIHMYDAIRAFDEQQKTAKAGRPCCNNRCVEAGIAESDVGPCHLCDPPWLKDCIAAAHHAWLATGASAEVINWHAIVRAVLAFAAAHPVEARPRDDWHEDLGDVLWWFFPVDEAPYVGSPMDDRWPGYHTHFTPLPPVPVPANANSSGEA